MSPETHHFSLGDYQGIVIQERERESPAEAMFGNVPADERMQVLAEFGLLKRGMIPDAFNVLYLESEQHRILVDTGLGQGDLYTALESQGIARESIDQIIITHGHGDHIGGLIGADYELMFPNADCFISVIEWRYWLNHPDQNNRNVMNWNRLSEVLPFERIHFIETDEEFLPGICPVFLPGHTPGQMGLLIELNGGALLHMADVAHHPLQCTYPQWSVNFDVDKNKARDTRWKLWARAANDDLLVMAYHFRHFGLGRVREVGETWTWEALLST